MAKGKPTPEKSKIERDRPLAYSRRQKPGGGEESDDAAVTDKPEAKADKPADPKPTEAKAADADAKPADAKPEAKAADETKPADAKPVEGDAEDKPAEAKAEDKPAEAAIEPPPPKGEPWPDATPQPMRPVDARARSATIAMPPELMVGAPPAVPGSVEDPTQMPGPQNVPGGNVTDAALPPGRVPAGDSRSLRKGSEFALIYRLGTSVITRFGTVGQRGQWRVVEYPTPAFAANSYAKEVSRYVGEGFLDYRD